MEKAAQNRVLKSAKKLQQTNFEKDVENIRLGITQKTKELSPAQRYMLEYHTQMCPTEKNGKGKCQDGNCMMAHSKKDVRRRPVLLPNGKWNYWPKFCTSVPNPSTCAQGENCCFAHNATEKKFHPLIFRTELCDSESKKGLCLTFGKNCTKAHGDHELRPYQDVSDVADLARGPAPPVVRMEPPLAPGEDGPPPPTNAQACNEAQRDFYQYKYKTKPCKKPGCKLCHRYHSVWERRRALPPDGAHYYSCTACPNVYDPKEGAWADPSACPSGDECPHSHTKTEGIYHPDKYKTSICKSFQENSCKYGWACAFAHGHFDLNAVYREELYANTTGTTTTTATASANNPLSSGPASNIASGSSSSPSASPHSSSSSAASLLSPVGVGQVEANNNTTNNYQQVDVVEKHQQQPQQPQQSQLQNEWASRTHHTQSSDKQDSYSENFPTIRVKPTTIPSTTTTTITTPSAAQNVHGASNSPLNGKAGSKAVGSGAGGGAWSSSGGGSGGSGGSGGAAVWGGSGGNVVRKSSGLGGDPVVNSNVTSTASSRSNSRPPSSSTATSNTNTSTGSNKTTNSKKSSLSLSNPQHLHELVHDHVIIPNNQNQMNSKLWGAPPSKTPTQSQSLSLSLSPPSSLSGSTAVSPRPSTELPNPNTHQKGFYELYSSAPYVVQNPAGGSGNVAIASPSASLSSSSRLVGAQAHRKSSGEMSPLRGSVNGYDVFNSGVKVAFGNSSSSSRSSGISSPSHPHPLHHHSSDKDSYSLYRSLQLNGDNDDFSERNLLPGGSKTTTSLSPMSISGSGWGGLTADGEAGKSVDVFGSGALGRAKLVSFPPPTATAGTTSRRPPGWDDEGEPGEPAQQNQNHHQLHPISPEDVALTRSLHLKLIEKDRENNRLKQMVTCGVCCLNPREIALIPCGHVTCKLCVQTQRLEPSAMGAQPTRTCPVCFTNCTAVQRIILS